MNKEIQREKKLHRDIFYFSITNDQWFEFAVFVLGFSTVTDALKSFLDNDQLFVIVVLGVFCILLTVKSYTKKREKIVPYGPEKQFIGLYSIDRNKKNELNVDNGLIPRDDEIEYLYNLIKECFSEQKQKRGVCLLGRSGSGKSTIINLFELEKDDSFEVLNFSENYNFFEEYFLQLYRNKPEKYITDSNKTVIILDHFERYFSLSEERKRKIKKIIQRVANLPVVFVFSMREEYFVQFITEFDINNLGVETLCRAREGIIFYKDYLTGSELKKENNILICLSEKESSNTDDPTKKTMKRLCEQAFGDLRGEKIYEHFAKASLIQQQIIFNMMKHDFEVNGEVAELKSDLNEDSMMKKYYDTQLCSTGDYFMASRIMYFLCVGRNSGISFSDDVVKNALMIFESKDVKKFKECLEKLHSLNLIKYTSRNSQMYYEIAHDYISKTFEVYANTEIPSNVKGVLDEFKSEYMRNTDINKTISQYRQQKHWKNTGMFGLIIFVFSISLTLACFLLKLINNFYGISWTTLILCMASLIYVYCFYMHITRHYRKKGWRFATFFYFCAMCLGTMASFMPDYWLQCLGAGNASVGLSCVIIGLNRHLAESGRRWFRSYGLKTFAVGLLLVAL